MSDVKDVSSQNIDIIRLVNRDNLFKKVKVYQYKDCRIIYCITICNQLRISGSTPKGPIDIKGFNVRFWQIN